MIVDDCDDDSVEDETANNTYLTWDFQIDQKNVIHY